MSKAALETAELAASSVLGFPGKEGSQHARDEGELSLWPMRPVNAASAMNQASVGNR